MSNFSIKDLEPNSNVYMVGIGGISMSALANILVYFNYNVSGSDANRTALTEKLQNSGITVYYGHSAENVKSPDLVCYTAAISDSNPELVKARSLGIPVIERAELLGEIMKLYRFPLAVAGTHGKTTTTSMLSLVLLAANLDPTILVGGELPQINGNYKIGRDDYLVLEACEYVESFLHFNPYLSIITNIEEDHLDYFTDLSHIISAFEKFARLNSKDGYIIVCSDDKNTRSIVQNANCVTVEYGINSKDVDFFAKNIEFNELGFPTFDVYNRNGFLLSLSLNVAGEHNIYNSLAVTAAAVSLGIENEYIKAGLEQFRGTKRRFEKIGEVNGFTVIDDYAHHPTEILTTLKTAKNMKYKNIWCVFQPHTYSRTKAFLDDFARSLSVADKVILTDIYPAREKYTGEVHSCDLSCRINNAIYMNDFSAIESFLKEEVKEGDLVITMGAGDVFKIGYDLVRRDA